MERIPLRDLERRYLRTGRVAHVLDVGTHRDTAACGMGLRQGEDWRGTGSQEEYERASVLPRCRVCVRYVGGEW